MCHYSLKKIGLEYLLGREKGGEGWGWGEREREREQKDWLSCQEVNPTCNQATLQSKFPNIDDNMMYLEARGLKIMDITCLRKSISDWDKPFLQKSRGKENKPTYKPVKI